MSDLNEDLNEEGEEEESEGFTGLIPGLGGDGGGFIMLDTSSYKVPKFEWQKDGVKISETETETKYRIKMLYSRRPDGTEYEPGVSPPRPPRPSQKSKSSSKSSPKGRQTNSKGGQTNSKGGFVDSQFVRTRRVKAPLKAFFLAIFLFLSGCCLLIFGILGVTGQVKHFEERMTPMFILGAMTFIPGAYHMALFVNILRGAPGYSFEDIPYWD